MEADRNSRMLTSQRKIKVIDNVRDMTILNESVKKKMQNKYKAAESGHNQPLILHQTTVRDQPKLCKSKSSQGFNRDQTSFNKRTSAAQMSAN